MKDLARHRDSATAYLAALQLRPDFPQAHFNLARAFQMLADDPGTGGYLRRSPTARRDVLLRAAHHFRRAQSSGIDDPGTGADSTRSQHLKSLEEVRARARGVRAAEGAHDRNARAPKRKKKSGR